MCEYWWYNNPFATTCQGASCSALLKLGQRIGQHPSMSSKKTKIQCTIFTSSSRYEPLLPSSKNCPHPSKCSTRGKRSRCNRWKSGKIMNAQHHNRMQASRCNHKNTTDTQNNELRQRIRCYMRPRICCYVPGLAQNSRRVQPRQIEPQLKFHKNSKFHSGQPGQQLPCLFLCPLFHKPRRVRDSTENVPPSNGRKPMKRVE